MAKTAGKRGYAMTKRLGWMAATLLAGGVVAVVACAQDLPQIFHINPARSEVKFHVPANGESADGKPNQTTDGSFTVKASSVRFVQADKTMSGQVIISAASERSGDAGKDKAIRSEVLQAKQYSTITFEPKRYEGSVQRTGKSEIQITGVLTLDGKPHEVTVPAEVESNDFVFKTTVRLNVPSADWGLPLSTLNGAKNVEVDAKLVGYVSPRN
jgi:polyisoprenoid-binding protein YceI